MIHMGLEQELKRLKKSYLFYENRLATFKNWKFKNELCTAEKMADAGFYFSKGCTQCCICEKSLEGWTEDDDPMTEHEAHSNNCPYVHWRKSKSGPLTFGDAIKLSHSRTLLQLDKEFNKLISCIKTTISP